MTEHEHPALKRKLIDAHYVEVMLLSDEARSYFETDCIAERAMLGAQARILFACEALKVSTRLMHMSNWLLDARGRVGEDLPPMKRAKGTAPARILSLPAAAREIISASDALYRRVQRLDAALHHAPPPSPVRAMHAQIMASL